MPPTPRVNIKLFEIFLNLIYIYIYIYFLQRKKTTLMHQLLTTSRFP